MSWVMPMISIRIPAQNMTCPLSVAQYTALDIIEIILLTNTVADVYPSLTSLDFGRLYGGDGMITGNGV